jgi:hypothetical protein
MPMVCKPNGNWENEEPYFKHDCKVSSDWRCFQRRDDKDLTLRLRISQCCHDDDYDIKVKTCPFCGYKVD